MITAQQFVEAARARGFDWYAGVPCSFLTPFINYVIGDPALRYISAANEGDAVAAIAGACLGGHRGVAMMQNSGLGNAVSPLTSLAYVFRIPMLLVCTHRGAPGVHDEPQHELMGQITGALFDTMRVPWEDFPTRDDDIGPALDRALAFIHAESRPYAFVMHKGSVAPHALAERAPASRARCDVVEGPETFDLSATARPSRAEVLTRLVRITPPDRTVVIATTGFTGRELYAIADRPNHLYMVGSMGCASALGLGLAMTRPDLHVVAVDGDGAALMRMGNLATVGAYAAGNFTHLLLDNEVHDSTGAQATVSASVDFAAIARACGYRHVRRGETLDALDGVGTAAADGPRFVHMKIRPGTIDNLPRPTITPSAVLRRLMTHLGSAR